MSTETIDAIVRHAMSVAHIPGAAVGIIEDGKVVHVAAFGVANDELQVAATPDTVFQIASATKCFTAALLLQFVDRGKLRLDDPVSAYISDAPAPWDHITVRQLAQHTTGLASQEPDPGPLTTEEAARRALAAKFDAKPGETSRYGAWDFTIVQHILEKISGKAYPELVHDELFVPLGMTSTVFENARDEGTARFGDPIAHRADAYAWDGKVNQRNWYRYPPYTYAAGGAFSSVRDVASFIAAIDVGSVVSEANRAMLWTPSVLTDGRRGEFAVGWAAGMYRGRIVGGHSGGPALSDVLYFPEARLGIVVLTNQKALSPVLANLIADALLPAPAGYLGVGVPDGSPQRTTAARALFEQMQRGHVEHAMLANEDGHQADNLAHWGAGWLALYPPVSGIVFLGEQGEQGGTRVRRYRVQFGDHVETINVQTNAAGLVMGLGPEGDAVQ